MSTSTSDQTFAGRNPLITFFLLVFMLTWPFLILDALGSHGIFPFRLNIPLLILTGYMPTLAAVILTGLTKGKEGVRALSFIARFSNLQIQVSLRTSPSGERLH